MRQPFFTLNHVSVNTCMTVDTSGSSARALSLRPAEPTVPTGFCGGIDETYLPCGT